MTITFVLMIGVPFVGLWFEPAANAEQRKLASFPELQTVRDGARPFTLKLEAFVNDRFGFRKAFLDLQAWLSFYGFGVSSSPRVIAGKDGWLFYTEDGSLSDLLGKTPPDQALTDAWVSSTKQRAAWLAERGIQYRVVIVPDKHSVYRDKLPPLLRPARKTRLDYLMAGLAAEPSVIDLRAEMTAKRSFPHDLYFRTDTHWNSLGASVAYSRIMASLDAPVAEGEFALALGPSRPRDLAVMARTESSEADIVPSQGSKATCAPGQVLPPLGLDVGAVLAMSAATCPGEQSTALIFHDSFMVSLTPFIRQGFERTVFAWTRPSDDLFVRMVEQEKPTVVIEERVERFMSFAPGTDLAGARGRYASLDSRNFTTASLAARENIYQLIRNGAVVEGDRIVSRGETWAEITGGPADGGFVGVGANQDGKILLHGWAAMVPKLKPAEYVILTRGKNVIFTAGVGTSRLDVANHYDAPAMEDTGFAFLMPKDILNSRSGDVRMFAVAGRMVHRIQPIDGALERLGDSKR
ncbi:alginate O-acetyltransferase AlgX-related protein [Bosea caraganae]|nr:hypothetical protein [Bosea caraganae]